MSQIYDCIIVGAGASGLFCAAADKSSGRKLILEKTSRPGQKLLMSGNGMCNITHSGSIKNFIDKYGDKGSRIRSCLYKHNNLELMAFFNNNGIPLVEREDGKVFPKSKKALDILDCLLAKAKANGWNLRCNQEVTGIEVAEDIKLSASCAGPVRLTLKDGSELETRKLVIATGGASYPATGSDGTFMNVLNRDLGLDTVKLKPALAPIYVQNYEYTNLAGVSFSDVEIAASSVRCRGPLLFTHKGLSGPAVLHMSQHVIPGTVLHISFLPEFTTAQVYQQLKQDHPGNNKGISNYISDAFALPKAFTDKMFVDPRRKFSTVGHKELENICHLLTDRQFSVSGTGGWNEAMVTAGGVNLDQIDLKTTQLKKFPDIRIIGEALDVNGDTGGYNLQFAWSSAMAAL